jgi:hypothetical protein
MGHARGIGPKQATGVGALGERGLAPGSTKLGARRRIIESPLVPTATPIGFRVRGPPPACS